MYSSYCQSWSYLDNQGEPGQCLAPFYTGGGEAKFYLWDCSKPQFAQKLHFEKCDARCPSPGGGEEDPEEFY